MAVEIATGVAVKFTPASEEASRLGALDPAAIAQGR